MRAVVQRVSKATVAVGGEKVGAIGPGLVVFLGVALDDVEADADILAKKIPELRIFRDGRGKKSRSMLDIAGELLIVSQFTLLGDCRKGRRPGFSKAARPEKAEALFDRFVARCRAVGRKVETGEFGAMMKVSLVNDGPITLLLDSKKLF